MNKLDWTRAIAPIAQIAAPVYVCVSCNAALIRGRWIVSPSVIQLPPENSIGAHCPRCLDRLAPSKRELAGSDSGEDDSLVNPPRKHPMK